jgi:hypothetical protein
LVSIQGVNLFRGLEKGIQNHGKNISREGPFMRHKILEKSGEEGPSGRLD